MTRLLSTLCAALACAIVGCVTAPQTERPANPVEPPDAFRAAEAEAAWVARIGTPELADLIVAVWESNPNLRRLAARVEQARAEARIAGATRYPQMSAGAEASLQETHVAFLPERLRDDRYTLSGTLSWEVDLWGRVRDARASADAAYEATVADFGGARLAVAAAAASLWYDLAESEAQIRLARRTLESFRANQRIVEQRYESGLDTALQLRLARSNTAAAESGLAARLRQRDGYARALETLLGRYPTGDYAPADQLPDSPDPVAPGLPSELLERRPDIRAAAARFAAAAHGHSAARKARLPALRLTGTTGVTSEALSEVLASDRFFWSLVGGLTSPIFDGGRISAETRRAVAQRHEAAYAYAETVLQAFQEVETALAAEGHLREQARALGEAAEDAREAERLATDRYERGLIPLTTLLEAQRRSFETQSHHLSIRAARLKNHVDLILALGGDFLTVDPPPHPHRPDLP